MKTNLNVGSLFAGVGGICLGLQQAENKKYKFNIVWANEIDEYAAHTYRTNFSHTLIEGDINLVLHPSSVPARIKELEEKVANPATSASEKASAKAQATKLKAQLADKYYEKMHELILKDKIDLLNGGFPCQAFSIAGERKGFQDERGNLFLSIVELINQLGAKHGKPRFLFLENVKNLKSHDGGRTYAVIKKKLEETGYTIKEHVLNTMDFSNLPQNRERIYIIGFLNKADAEKFDLFDHLDKYRITKIMEQREEDIRKIIDYQSDLPEKYYYTKEKYPHYFVTKEEFRRLPQDKTRINLTEDITEYYQFYQLRRGMYVRKNQSGVCPTLTANMGTGGHNVPLVLTKKGIRKITPAEAYRLQGFPVGNGYSLPTKINGQAYGDANLYKQAGNAVSVPVIKFIAEHILALL